MIMAPKLYRHRYLVLGFAGVIIFIFGTVFDKGLQAEQSFSFLLGVLVSDNHEKAFKKITDFRGIAFLLVLGIMLLGLKQVSAIRVFEDTAIWWGIQLIMKVSVAIALIGMVYVQRSFFNNRMVSSIGLISYEIYLVHINILFLPSTGIIGIIEFLTLSLCGASMIHWMTERIGKKLLS